MLDFDIWYHKIHGFNDFIISSVYWQKVEMTKD